MKQPICLFALALFLGSGSLFAQQTQTVQPQMPAENTRQEDRKIEKTEINRQELSSDKITLVRDANLPPVGERTPGSTLERQMSGRGPDQVMGPDNQPLDINKIRVITPEQYKTLAPDAQKAIDQDPYYVVSDKERKEVMVEFIRRHAQVSAIEAERQTMQIQESLPSQQEKDAEKAAQKPHSPE